MLIKSLKQQKLLLHFFPFRKLENSLQYTYTENYKKNLKLMEQVRRNSRKMKTAMIDQRPRSNYQSRNVPKDVCKSINIFPIKIQNPNINNEKHHNESQKHFNASTTSSLICNKENNKRRTLLSIKSKVSIKFDNADQLKALFQSKDQVMTDTKIMAKNQKKNSLSFTNSGNGISSCDQTTQRLFQLLHKKKDILMLDHSRLVIEATKFKSILNDFQYQIREIKTDRDTLSQKVDKYEHYFKQMKLKHIPTFDQEQNNQKNQQLKILNLQKKVQTLNYIIKQYRTSNSQEIKSFQQKLKDFKPNIERQLTEKLAQTNQKYDKLLKKVDFFQKQCKSNLKVEWQNLMTQFQETKVQNQKHVGLISQLSQKLNQLSSLMAQNNQKMKSFQKLEDQIVEKKQKIQKLTDRKIELQQQIQEKDKKIDQLGHLYQQTSFKLEGLKNLQFRIQNKDKTIKKNTIVINRLQCQNIELKTKIDTVLGDFQSRLFCQKNLQQNLLKANSTIHDLTNRLHQTFVDFCQNPSVQSTKEKQYFIGHLFEKVKNSYNQIISEYQNQLKLTNNQCDKWKQTFNLISKNQDQKFKYIEKTQFDLMRIQQKKLRCHDLFNKVSNYALDQQKRNNKQCENCKHLIAHWGQLQNSYSQLKAILEKVMKMESQNPLTVKEEQKQIPEYDQDGPVSKKSVCVFSIQCL